MSFDALPRRIYFDTNVIGALWDHADAIFEGAPFGTAGRSGADQADVEALRAIFLIGQRAHFELVISDANLDEVAAAPDGGLLRWALEILAYWQSCADAYGDAPVVSGRGVARLDALDGCGYLSAKDRLIVTDAVLLECDALLTLERARGCLGAPSNRRHMHRTLGLTVLGPQDLWERLRPWSALFV